MSVHRKRVILDISFDGMFVDDPDTWNWASMLEGTDAQGLTPEEIEQVHIDGGVVIYSVREEGKEYPA